MMSLSQSFNEFRLHGDLPPPQQPPLSNAPSAPTHAGKGHKVVVWQEVVQDFKVPDGAVFTQNGQYISKEKFLSVLEDCEYIQQLDEIPLPPQNYVSMQKTTLTNPTSSQPFVIHRIFIEEAPAGFRIFKQMKLRSGARPF